MIFVLCCTFYLFLRAQRIERNKNERLIFSQFNKYIGEQRINGLFSFFGRLAEIITIIGSYHRPAACYQLVYFFCLSTHDDKTKTIFLCAKAHQ